MLIDMLPAHGIDTGMVTYLSCSLPEQKRLFQAASSESPYYFTGSRPVAAALREQIGPVMASTGGPNTLVATSFTPEIAEAVRMSACIENSGQCTALRHAVVNCSADEVKGIFDGTPVMQDSRDALTNGEFAGIFADAGAIMNHADGYTQHPDNANICYRQSTSLPPIGIEEEWRNVYADVTSPGDVIGNDANFTAELADWLVKNQPITLAVNDDGASNFGMGLQLFEQTGQVVYTVGTVTNPALTCQARPQDGEVFGEFPVRRELKQYTKFPVVVPTPTPAYNSVFETKYLREQGDTWAVPADLSAFVEAVESSSNASNSADYGAEVKGYMRVLFDYLADVCTENPKVGHNNSNRTALFGLQTTPHNGQPNILRCGPDTTAASLGPYLLPFHATSAGDNSEGSGLRVSVDPRNTALLSVISTVTGVEVVEEDAAAFAAAVERDDPYNVVDCDSHDGAGEQIEFSMPGQFISTLLCVGHIKSVKPNDQEFIDAFSASKKWLAMRY